MRRVDRRRNQQTKRPTNRPTDRRTQPVIEVLWRTLNKVEYYTATRQARKSDVANKKRLKRKLKIVLNGQTDGRTDATANPVHKVK